MENEGKHQAKIETTGNKKLLVMGQYCKINSVTKAYCTTNRCERQVRLGKNIATQTAKAQLEAGLVNYCKLFTNPKTYGSRD